MTVSLFIAHCMKNRNISAFSACARRKSSRRRITYTTEGYKKHLQI